MRQLRKSGPLGTWVKGMTKLPELKKRIRDLGLQARQAAAGSVTGTRIDCSHRRNVETRTLGIRTFNIRNVEIRTGETHLGEARTLGIRNGETHLVETTVRRSAGALSGFEEKRHCRQ